MNENKKMTLLDALNLARKGVSLKSIAAKAGIKHEEFLTILERDPEVKRVFEMAQADWEIDNALILEQVLSDPEAPASLKAKVARENLKTMEQWATASKAIRVVHSGDAGMKFPDQEYENITPDDFARIKAETEEKHKREKGGSDE